MALEQSLAQLSLASVSAENALTTKTLVFKPKTAKTATPVPVVVIALQDTKTPTSLVAASALVKEPRMASADLVEEFFKVAPTEVSIANLHKDLAGKIKILLDQKIKLPWNWPPRRPRPRFPLTWWSSTLNQLE